MSSANDLEGHRTDPHRIALCITELDVGGAERFLVELATRLNRNLFQPTVYCLGPRPSGAGETLAARLAAAGVPTVFLGGRAVRDAWRVLRQLRNELRRQRPALIQTFLWHANVLGPLAARRLVADGKTRASIPIVTGLRVAEPRRRWRRPLERWAGCAADRHVAVSEGVARFARERIGLAPEKIIVIPNGVEVDRFPAPPVDSRSLGVRHGRRFLLFVGRLDDQDQKGARVLVEHAPELLSKLEDHDLVIVGDGPTAERLRNRSAELGLQDRVHWLGWRSDLPRIIAAADLLIAPSRWEGMSNVVLEAMASGKAIVAHAAEGISDLLNDQPRQIVPVGDWPGFVDRIVDIAADHAAQIQLGEANRQRVVSYFRFEQEIASYERLYLELIGGSQTLPKPKF